MKNQLTKTERQLVRAERELVSAMKTTRRIAHRLIRPAVRKFINAETAHFLACKKAA